MTHTQYRLFAIVSFILLALGTLLLFLHPFQQFDVALLNLIQRQTPFILDDPLALLSVLGNFEIISLPIAFLIWSTKNPKLRFLLAIAYVFGSAIEVFSKYSFTHPGPPLAFYRNNLHITLPTSQIVLGSSYPSGHSFRSTFLAILINFYWVHIKKKPALKINIILSLLLALMLVSRVSLGEHWPSDVVGGFLLALTLVTTVFAIALNKHEKKS